MQEVIVSKSSVETIINQLDEQVTRTGKNSYNLVITYYIKDNMVSFKLFSKWGHYKYYNHESSLLLKHNRNLERIIKEAHARVEKEHKLSSRNLAQLVYNIERVLRQDLRVKTIIAN